MKQALPFVTLLLGLVAVAGLYNAIYRADYKSGADVVYDICQSARLETSGDSELACGYVQDFYAIEYLCKERNNSINNKCWTERAK